MKVGIVSTYEQACGVATYTEHLARALVSLPDVEVVILAMKRPSGYPRRRYLLRTEGLKVVTCWERHVIGAQLVEAVKAEALDLVHLQHEHGLFMDFAGRSAYMDPAQLIETLKALVSLVPVVATLHTVAPQWRGFYQVLGNLGIRTIVHTRRAQGIVAGTGVFGLVVPHGTPPAPPGDAARGREMLGVGDEARIILVSGFISKFKATLGTIRSFIQAVPNLPQNVHLVVVGQPDDSEYSRVLVPQEAGRMPGRITVRPGWVPAIQVPDLLAAANWAVLNTTSTTCSASGQVHMLAPYMPLCVASRPIYDEAMAAGALPFHVGEHPQEPQEQLVAAFVAMGRDNKLAADVRKDMLNFAKATTWTSLVKTYLDIYKMIINKWNPHD